MRPVCRLLVHHGEGYALQWFSHHRPSPSPRCPCAISPEHASIASRRTVGLMCLVWTDPPDQEKAGNISRSESNFCGASMFYVGGQSDRCCVGPTFEVSQVQHSAVSGQTELCFLTGPRGTSKDGSYPIPRFCGGCPAKNPPNCQRLSAHHRG